MLFRSKIKQEYNTDERLESFVNDIINSSQCYLQFNSEEMSKILPGKDSATPMMKMLQLSLPEYNDSSDFREKFINMFTKCCPGFKASDVSLNYKPNQIVVVAAASGFPIRYLANAANLKEPHIYSHTHVCLALHMRTSIDFYWASSSKMSSLPQKSHLR